MQMAIWIIQVWETILFCCCCVNLAHCCWYQTVVTCFWNFKMLLIKMTCCFIRSRKLLGSLSLGASFVLAGTWESEPVWLSCFLELCTLFSSCFNKYLVTPSWETAKPDPRPGAWPWRLLVGLYLKTVHFLEVLPFWWEPFVQDTQLQKFSVSSYMLHDSLVCLCYFSPHWERLLTFEHEF